MSEQSYGGRCLCGQVRYRVSEVLRDLCYCHCETCRRAAGAYPVAWGTVRRRAFETTQGRIAIYRSSPGVERGFCAHCGTTLTYWQDRHGEDIDVALATLDDPGVFPPERHIWLRDELRWARPDDALPRFETGSDTE